MEIDNVVIEDVLSTNIDESKEIITKHNDPPLVTHAI